MFWRKVIPEIWTNSIFHSMFGCSLLLRATARSSGESGRLPWAIIIYLLDVNEVCEAPRTQQLCSRNPTNSGQLTIRKTATASGHGKETGGFQRALRSILLIGLTLKCWLLRCLKCTFVHHYRGNTKFTLSFCSLTLILKTHSLSLSTHSLTAHRLSFAKNVLITQTVWFQAANTLPIIDNMLWSMASI